jgi:hypothetical protein
MPHWVTFRQQPNCQAAFFLSLVNRPYTVYLKIFPLPHTCCSSPIVQSASPSCMFKPWSYHYAGLELRNVLLNSPLANVSVTKEECNHSLTRQDAHCLLTFPHKLQCHPWCLLNGLQSCLILWAYIHMLTFPILSFAQATDTNFLPETLWHTQRWKR